MKKFLFLTAFVLGLVACGNKQAETQNTVTENAKLADCDITINGIHFTKSINGAEKLEAFKTIPSSLHTPSSLFKNENPSSTVLANPMVSSQCLW